MNVVALAWGDRSRRRGEKDVGLKGSWEHRLTFELGGRTRIYLALADVAIEDLARAKTSCICHVAAAGSKSGRQTCLLRSK